MSAEAEITVWLNQITSQPDEAMGQLWEVYYSRLVRHARQKLGALPRRAVDEEDVALSALHSFCEGVRRNQFPDLKDREGLWKLLLTMTARKASSQVRSQLAQKRGGGQVRGDSVFAKVGDSTHSSLVAVEPTERDGVVRRVEILFKNRTYIRNSHELLRLDVMST